MERRGWTGWQMPEMCSIYKSRGKFLIKLNPGIYKVKKSIPKIQLKVIRSDSIPRLSGLSIHSFCRQEIWTEAHHAKQNLF